MVGLNQGHLRMCFGVFLLSVLGSSTGFTQEVDMEITLVGQLSTTPR
jgi:hypothetical protein